MKFWKYCTFSLSILLTGCASSSIFISYPSKMSTNMSQMNQGQYQPCISTLTKDQQKKGPNSELISAELGRAQQLSGNYSGSTATYMPLMSKIEAAQLQAKVTVTGTAEQAGSIATNDNALPYQLAGYEIIFLYEYQALNFIAQGNISDALVAARKSNNLQAYLAQDYQKQLAKAEDQAQQHKLDPSKSMNDQTPELKSTLAASASVKSSFANAMSYYLSGMLFLATNDLNDATVAFKQAITIMPDNTFLQNTLLTTMQMQGAPKSDISNYQKAFGMKTLPAPPKNKAVVLVMYDQNFVSPRIAVNIPVVFSISGANQIQSLSFPAYPDAPAVTPLSVSLGEQKLADTQLIVNTNALAAKNLVQQYPMIFVREALRFLAKSAAVTAVQNSHNGNGNNDLAAVLMQAYNILSDQADLRSWLTLPQDTQIAHYILAPGTYHFQFSNNSLSANASANLTANQYYLIWVRQYGKEMQAQIFNF